MKKRILSTLMIAAIAFTLVKPVTAQAIEQEYGPEDCSRECIEYDTVYTIIWSGIWPVGVTSAEVCVKTGLVGMGCD